MIGLFIQLRVQRDDAAIGIFEFLVETFQLVLPLAQFFEHPQQFTVLLLDLVHHVAWPLGGQAIDERRNLSWREQRRAAWQQLAHADDGADAGLRLDGELIHQPARADQAQAHAGRGSIASSEDFVEILDALTFVRDNDAEELRGRLPLDREMNLAAAGVAEGVARDLRHGGSDADLILVLEAEQLRDLARALARRHHVAFVLNRDHHDRDVHRPRTTATVASSRPRLKSRYSTPAIKAGLRSASPG